MGISDYLLWPGACGICIFDDSCYTLYTSLDFSRSRCFYCRKILHKRKKLKTHKLILNRNLTGSVNPLSLPLARSSFCYIMHRPRLFRHASKRKQGLQAPSDYLSFTATIRQIALSNNIVNNARYRARTTKHGICSTLLDKRYVLLFHVVIRLLKNLLFNYTCVTCRGLAIISAPDWRPDVSDQQNVGSSPGRDILCVTSLRPSGGLVQP